MNVICREAKNYKLTVGNPYEILKQEGEWYFLVNDNGKNVKYAKELFEVEEEAAPRTEQDMIDSITINYDNMNDSYTLAYEDLNGEDQEFDLSWEDEDRSGISCGIGEKCGIDSILSVIAVNVPQDDDYLNLQKALLRKFIQKTVVEDNGKAMHLISTTTSQDTDLLSVLDDMSDLVTEEKLNPNSNNRIKMWVFYTN